MDLLVLSRAYFSHVWDVPILVTPICIVRRSRSLPDDSESTNQAPDLVDVADLNDLTSSKSGASGNSIDKQDQDGDEEADQFEDASPLTPVHSPKRKATVIPLQISTGSSTKSKKSAGENAVSSSSEKSSPAGVVPQENSTRDLLLFTDGVVPVVNVTILRELTTPESRYSLVKQPELKTSPGTEGDSQRRLEIERDEIGKDFTAYDTGPSTSGSTYRQERRKSIKRQGSLVKEKSTEEEIILGVTEDNVGRKLAVADYASGETALASSQLETRELIAERRKSARNEAVEEAARKLAKERRKSLKEQKSIERVNEYLAKHSGESAAKNECKNPELASLERRRKSMKEMRPIKGERSAERRQSLAVDMGLMKTSTERRKSLTKQEHVEIVGENHEEGAEETTGSGIAGEEENETEKQLDGLDSAEQNSGPERTDNLAASGPEITPSTAKQSPEDSESGRSVSRRSSVKKKEGQGSFEKDGSSGEIGKREVKIRENVEEFFYEHSNDQVTAIPEVRLVRAKIISVEEAAANLSGRVQCGAKIELNSPPEIVSLSADDKAEKQNPRTRIRKAALSAEERDEGLLSLPGLTKSTSENVLVETQEEENTVSGKNFKPDILLDLSKVPDEADQPQEKPRESVNSPKDKRLLSRVGSEGSKIIHEAKLSARISTSGFIASALPSTGMKDVSETTSAPRASLSLQDKDSTPVIQTAIDSREEETSASEQPSGVIGETESGNKIVGENFNAEDAVKDGDRADSEPEPVLSFSSKTLSDPLENLHAKEIPVEEPPETSERLDEPKAKEPQREVQANSAKPEVVTKTVYTSDFPIKKSDCGYKSVNQRLREREFSGSFSPKVETLVSRLKQPSESFSGCGSAVVTDVTSSGQQRTQQILTTDKEAEEQRQKALEKQREHEKFLQQRRTVLEEETFSVQQPAIVPRDGGNLIGKEHSLEYQSQTLEARFEELENKRSTSSENLSSEDTEEEGVAPEVPPVEKREAETQTQQETKSTQCGTDEVFESVLKSAKHSLSSLAEGPEYLGSPRKEVETQTQGETKGTQCGPDDLAETFSQLKTFFRQKSLTHSLGSLGSPRREVEVQTEQESKSVQCTPEDIPGSPLRSSIFFRRSAADSQQKSSEQPRREAEVQTYQESKATQFSSEEPGQSSSKASEPRHLKFPLGPDPLPAASLYTSSPIIVLVDGRTDMTVTHNYKDKDGNVVWAKHWGPERMVEIYREPRSSLGLSIVGGKVDLYHGGPNTSQNISGIFIKNVLPNSPAGRTGDLKTGDRIIEVDGVDLRNSTHDRAVKAIQAAGNPVCLLVQSLIHLSPDEERTSSRDTDENSGARGVRRQGTRGHGAIVGAAPATPTTSFRRKPSAVSPARTITPELIQEGIEDEAKQGTSRSDYRRQSTRNDSDRAGTSVRRSSMKQSLRKKAPSPPKGAGIIREVSEEGEEQQPQQTKPKYSSDESSDEEDTRDLEGNVYTKAGIEISRKSAGNVKRSREEIEADPEQEDEFGYTAKKIKKRYDALGHPVVMVRLEKDRRGLGISLAGHKDRNRMAVFVCGLNPKGVAHKTGGLHIGDEILEVNGTVLQGRCHLNASAMIKGMAGTCFKVIVLRRSSAVNDLAVKPIVQFPPTLDEDDPDRFNQYKGVRTVSIKKGQYGLGIMIIEGKHAEVGQGIFVSDIQEGSAAEQAGLQVGDMILAVNLDCLLGSSHDEATGLLKKTEGVVTLTVCNPNQSKLAKEEEEKAKGGDSTSPNGVDSKAAKEPEKPKEPEPPKDPKDCEISVGKETTIEFPKDKDKAIGFSIAGGSGTPLGGIVILEVFPEGAAGKDGRLKPGDQIIEMCHESFKAIEHAKAHEAILKAVSGPIHMVVFRDDKPPDEFDVELPKKSGKGVGLCLTGFKSGKGAYVSDMLPGGSAVESGKISKGDRVVAVGGQDVREAPVEDIALHVKVANPVQLKLARYKTVKQ